MNSLSSRTGEPVVGPTELKRVWFVGAGFTTAVGYPLGRGLVGDLVDYLREGTNGFSAFSQSRKITNSVAGKHNTKDRRRILTDIFQFAQQYLALSPRALRNVDVAEFFSIAQALAEQPGIFGGGPQGPLSSGQQSARFAHLYSDLAAITRSFFLDVCDSVTQWPDDFRSILGRIQPPTDAIVNFNWDEEVDCFLSIERDRGHREFDVAYTAASWSPNSFLVLKPHGSIGWYDLAQGVANSDQYLIAGHDDKRIDRFDKRLMSYTEFEFPADLATGQKFALECPPVITAPTFGKRFPYPEQRLIWGDVIKMCHRAEEFVFLGYSVPPDDFLTRAAIRFALQQNRQKVRCLVLTLHSVNSPAGVREVQKFQDVFGRGFGAQNLFTWTFGQSPGGKQLYAQIISRLGQAHV